MGESDNLRPLQTMRVIPHFGRFRLVSDLNVQEVLFLLFAFVSVIGTGVITIIRISDTSHTDPESTFAIILLVNLVFIIYYVVHGVFCERPLEILVSVIATLIVMLYCIVEFAVHGHLQTGEKYKLKLARLIAVCAIGPVDIILGCMIAFKYVVSGNLIFRTVGGNALLQRMCKMMFFFAALLKLDFQMVINLLIMALVGNIHEVTLGEKLVIGLGTPFSLLWLILGFVMVRYELLKWSWAFWIFSVAEPAYIIFLFVRTKGDLNVAEYTQEKSALLLLYCIFLAGAIALLIRIALVVLSVFVTRNFGKGLKEKVFCDDAYLTTNE